MRPASGKKERRLCYIVEAKWKPHFRRRTKITSSKIKSKNFPLDLAKLESLGTLRKTVSMKRVSSVYC